MSDGVQMITCKVCGGNAPIGASQCPNCKNKIERKSLMDKKYIERREVLDKAVKNLPAGKAGLSAQAGG